MQTVSYRDIEYDLGGILPEGAAPPYRKVGELLLILASQPGRILDRDDVSSRLWPTSDRNSRLANLRQALSQLRSLLGTGKVLSNRSGCGVAASVRLRNPVPREDLTDTVRPEFVESLLDFLEHVASNSPIQFFDTLRVNADCIVDLPGPRLTPLAQRAREGLPHQHPLQGWAAYVAGQAAIGQIPIAKPRFRQSLEFALTHRDLDLIQRSAHWYGACLILSGQAEAALSVVHRAEAVIGSKPGLSLNWLESIKSTAHLHAGRFTKAIEVSDRLSYADCANPSEWWQHQAIRAFYLATTGRIDAAQKANETLQAPLNRTISTRAAVVSTLTSWVIAANLNPKGVQGDLATWVAALEREGHSHFTLYGLETLATAYAKGGAPAEARATLVRAFALRSKIGITMTHWDRARLAPACG